MSAFGQHEPRERQHRDADWDVDEEDPVPAERVRQDPAQQDANRSAAGGDESEDPHRFRPLRRLGEEGDDERERHSGDDGRAEALQRPGADQQDLGPRESTTERRESEDHDSDQEQTSVAEEIPQPAG
jgi:hypothetical protein